MERTQQEREVEDVEEHEDVVCTMDDVIKEEERMEADANAVLGDSDDKNCTYPQGYVARQALYACRTCRAPDNLSGAICLACSYACHEGHDLIELYTKRNYRCDCGNDRFPNMKCSLFEFKDHTNTSNRYNQNFEGLYCTCARPYPDPTDQVADEMIQCVICEDWHHGRHSGTEVPPNDNYEEMICGACMGKHSWLWAYTPTCVEVMKLVKGDDSTTIDPCNIPVSESGSDKTDNPTEPTHDATVNGVEETEATEKENSESSTSQSAHSSQSPAKSESLPSSTCILSDLLQRDITEGKGGVFLSGGWRAKLCHCPKCRIKYTEEGVSFLIDLRDSVKSYEDRGHVMQSHDARLQRGMDALQGMDRVVLGEVMHGYNDLKESLKDYLQKFADNKKVVREEDIREFFEGMEARKKKRLDEVPQSRCMARCCTMLWSLFRANQCVHVPYVSWDRAVPCHAGKKMLV